MVFGFTFVIAFEIVKGGLTVRGSHLFYCIKYTNSPTVKYAQFKITYKEETHTPQGCIDELHGSFVPLERHTIEVFLSINSKSKFGIFCQSASSTKIKGTPFKVYPLLF